MSTTADTWTVRRQLVEDTLTDANIFGEDGVIRDNYIGRGDTTPGFGVVVDSANRDTVSNELSRWTREGMLERSARGTYRSVNAELASSQSHA